MATGKVRRRADVRVHWIRRKRHVRRDTSEARALVDSCSDFQSGDVCGAPSDPTHSDLKGHSFSVRLDARLPEGLQMIVLLVFGKAAAPCGGRSREAAL